MPMSSSTFGAAKNMVFRIKNFGDQSAATRTDGVIGNGDREIAVRVSNGKLLGASARDREERPSGKQEHKRASQQKGKANARNGSCTFSWQAALRGDRGSSNWRTCSLKELAGK